MVFDAEGTLYIVEAGVGGTENQIIGPEGAPVERSRDDGEVGHPGRVLLEILRRHDLAGGIVVSRIFGGVKLGVGGVSRAFREAGEGVVEAARGGGPG
jgi:putative IMPACT (imprinted ancient) family translation regulator